ncbi:hypothetical protein PINS_up019705 [Pythium insidiosum]|nr:hypothetical protein PINS_up019705 [Pythium insidiosum]
MSYNAFAVTAPPNAVGVTASPLGFVVSVGLLWPLPTLVATAVITVVNAGRLRSKALAALHNHVVVAVLWFAVLWLMCAAPVRQRLQRISDDALRRSSARRRSRSRACSSAS